VLVRRKLQRVTAPDYFALLDEPRRPWLDPDALKQKFLARSANAHPDKVHTAPEPERHAAAQKFAALNAACHCLARPKLRLLHLLELERGAKPKEVREIPNALAGIFTDVATACREADRFLSEKAKTDSPLLQVQLFERGMEWIDQLNALQKKLSTVSEELIAALRDADLKWMTRDAITRAELLDELEDLYRLFSYFDRWHGQIRERIVQLSL
jgi:DnaJ-domain-containing protein 1